jgi:predicted KAP-like P-loop ATPase
MSARHEPGIVPISADVPIARREDDRLARRGFSEALAIAISGWSGSQSLVIALIGPWGSGKSSVKNMALETLREAQDQRNLRIVELNPWQIGNREKLTEFFFSELGKAVGSSKFISGDERSRIVRSLRKYKTYIQLGLSTGEPVRASGFLAMLAAIPLVQWAVSALGPESSLLVAVGCAGLILLSRLGVTFLDAAISRYELGKQSLDDLKRELARALSHVEGQFLIVVDDVDRLVPSEVYELFQLIKSNCDLPRLTYLALFDRRIVEESVTKFTSVPGKDYLEKIVQISFDIPALDRRDVDRLLQDALAQALSRHQIGDLSRSDSDRWSSLYIRGLRAYFDSPRRVFRFVSMFDFQLGLFARFRTLEVNVVDLLVLEVIRLFEPNLFQALPGNRFALIQAGWDDAISLEGHRSLDAVLKMCSEDGAARVRLVLEDLFPLARAGASATDESLSTWRRERRVCSEEFFDRYFQFSLRDTDMKQTDIQELLEASGDAERFAGQLMHLRARGLLDASVRQLASHVSDIPEGSIGVVIRVLFDIAEVLPWTSRLSLEVGADRFVLETVEVTATKDTE